MNTTIKLWEKTLDFNGHVRFFIFIIIYFLLKV